MKNTNAVFSGVDVKADGEVFEGVNLRAAFGAIECDLSTALITGDCVINAVALFGGIDVIAPDNVNIKVNSHSLFEGISQKKKNGNNNTYTLYINAISLFGGIDII